MVSHGDLGLGGRTDFPVVENRSWHCAAGLLNLAPAVDVQNRIHVLGVDVLNQALEKILFGKAV